MSFLEVFAQWAGVAAPVLERIIRSGAANVPDSQADADTVLAKLNQAVTPEGLAAVVGALPAEVANVFRGLIEPEDHPSDLA